MTSQSYLFCPCQTTAAALGRCLTAGNFFDFHFRFALTLGSSASAAKQSFRNTSQGSNFLHGNRMLVAIAAFITNVFLALLRRMLSHFHFQCLLLLVEIGGQAD